MTDMTTRQLGRNGPHVSALGLGCGSFTRTGNDAEREAVRTLQAARDAGFTLLDTADFYGSGVSELRVGGHPGPARPGLLERQVRCPEAPNGRIIGLDGRPKSVKTFAAYSLKRLGVDVIDLYQPSRADPDVPYEDTIGAIRPLAKVMSGRPSGSALARIAKAKVSTGGGPYHPLSQEVYC